MPESNLPEGTATDDARSYDDGVKAIEDLIDLDEPNLDEDGAEPEEPVEGEAGPDDTETDSQEADGPDEVGKGGKFVSNDAKVTLNDGTVITVQDLKRGFMSQQSFTRSTQETAELKRSYETRKAEVDQTAQAVGRQRDFLLQAAQQLIPQEPQFNADDPLGYMQAKAEYEQKMRLVNQILYQSQTEKQRLSQEEEEARKTLRQTEAQKLWEAVPEFRDRKVYDQFWSDASKVMVEEYGYTDEELAEAVDHRQYKIMRDLVKYQNALKRAKSGQVKNEVGKRPQLLQGNRRMDPKAKISREAQGRAEQLRKSGSFEDGINALMDHV